MEKKHLQSRRLRKLMNERWKPYIKYNKEEDSWITKAIRIDGEKREGMDRSPERVRHKVLMDRKQLDIIARLVAYMYHDKKDEYEELASDMRKEHIYRDLRAIDIWLNSQYKRLETEDEQSKQNKGKYL